MYDTHSYSWCAFNFAFTKAKGRKRTYEKYNNLAPYAKIVDNDAYRQFGLQAVNWYFIISYLGVHEYLPLILRASNAPMPPAVGMVWEFCIQSGHSVEYLGRDLQSAISNDKSDLPRDHRDPCGWHRIIYRSELAVVISVSINWVLQKNKPSLLWALLNFSGSSPIIVHSACKKVSDTRDHQILLSVPMDRRMVFSTRPTTSMAPSIIVIP